MDSDILRLTSIITESAKILDSYAKSYEPQMFSFDVNAPARVGIHSEEVKRAKCVAISSCMELIDRIQGPMNCLQPLWNGTGLQAISRFNIATHVPLDEEISYAELSHACGVHEFDLKQIIRFSIIHHRVFAEKRKGFVSHSANSRVLAQSPLAQAGVGQFDEFNGSFARTTDAIQRFKGHEPNETGFSLSHNVNENLFEYLSTRPDKAKQFAGGLKFYQDPVPECSPKHLATGYPWESLTPGTKVVDVGGSVGHVGRLIAGMNPGIQVTVQDLPEVIKEAELMQPSNGVDEDKSEEVTIQLHAHDFFHPQPLQADIYIFRWVMHDWPEDYVVRILKQQIPALKKGAKIVVNESLCPEVGSLPLSVERYIRWMDLMMLALNNSRLRDEEEWRALFREASPRFGPVKIWTPPGSALAIIEVEWQGE